MLTENRLYAMTDGQKGGPIIDFEFGIRNSSFWICDLELFNMKKGFSYPKSLFKLFKV